MARGRPARLQRLYELELGESLALHPDEGETVEALAKKVRQVATLYLREGKAFRLEKRDDHVLATRVAVGSHRRLSHLTDLKKGERYFVAETLDWKEKKALLAQLERLRFSSGGLYYAEVDHDGIYVRCYLEPGGRTPWNEKREHPVPNLLNLRRD